MQVFGVCLILLISLLSPTTSSLEYTYVNPVIDSNHPDPGVLRLGNNSYVAVTTSQDAINATTGAFPIITSPDLANWTLNGYVFPKGQWPSWAYKDMWAPEIHFVNKRYIVYFAARHIKTNKLCIGAAISSKSHLGPYKDLGQPLVKNDTVPGIGVIDVHHFYDVDGTPYLIWKTDGNAVGHESAIMLREINKDGVSFNKSSIITQLLQSSFIWERLIVEGPWMIFSSGYYYLFYSADYFAGYSVAVARSRNIRGPYQQHHTTILHTDFNKYVQGINTTFIGPGHCSVVQAESGDWWIVYHAYKWGKALAERGWAAWRGNERAAPSAWATRVMLIDKISWSTTGWPTVGEGYPSVTPQPTPLYYHHNYIKHQQTNKHR